MKQVFHKTPELKHCSMEWHHINSSSKPRKAKLDLNTRKNDGKIILWPKGLNLFWSLCKEEKQYISWLLLNSNDSDAVSKTTDMECYPKLYFIHDVWHSAHAQTKHKIYVFGGKFSRTLLTVLTWHHTIFTCFWNRNNI